MTDEKNPFSTEEEQGEQNPAPAAESNERKEEDGAQTNWESRWQNDSGAHHVSWGQENFRGNGGKPPKKNRTSAWIVLLVVLYVALAGGVLGLIATGVLRLNTGPQTEERPADPVTSEEKQETATGEQNAPIVEKPGENGESGIVGEGYTGQTISASQLYENNVDSIVFVEANYRQGKGTGSGFVIDSENGYILTNYHVVSGSNDVAVTFKNSDSYSAKIIGGDEINDVAVLKIEAKGLKHVTIGNSDQVKVGEDVLIIGNPLGDLTFTMTRGIVSAVDRIINTGEYNIETFQTDTAINSGNSGGPAFDSTGAVIGIASAKYAASGVEGIGFCIPINDAMEIARDLVSHGYVTGRPNFGIAVSDSLGYEIVTDSFGRRVKVDTALGAKVEQVGKDSCAAKAGLQVGDIITKLGEKKVQTANELINAKNSYKAGDTVSLEVYRSGETLTLSVVFDEYIPTEES